jgi:5-methylcytosine-specific restriction endonuclease McrA
MKKVSSKMAKQKIKERKLSQELLEQSGGVCQLCGRAPDFRGLSKHEIVFRSQGGDPLDKKNVKLLCGDCHDRAHGIKPFHPYSKEMQLHRKIKND